MRRKVLVRKSKKNCLKILIFFVLVFLIFKGVLFFAQLWSNRWKEEEQFNLFLQFKTRSFLVSLNLSRQMVVVVGFPNKMLVEAFGGYGEFRLDKLLGLAHQEKKQKLFPKSLEYFFGFSLNQWFVFPQEELKIQKRDLKEALNEKIKFLFLSPNNLELIERIDLFNFSRSLKKRSLSWQIFEAERQGWVVDNRLQKAVWDSWAEVYLADESLKKEGLGIGVYNTTERKGLASKTARILNNVGARVVKVGNARKKVENCLVGIKEEKVEKSATVRKIKRLLDCPVKVLLSSEFVDLTDINIYLGERFLSGLKK